MTNPERPGEDPANDPDTLDLPWDLDDESPPPESGAAGPPPEDAHAADESAAAWHVALPDGREDGPFTLEQLRERIRNGRLRPTDIVWREGLPAWIPARTVPGLEEAFPTAAPPPPRPERAPASVPGGLTDMQRTLDRWFSRPEFFRTTGRICGVLGIGVFLLSLPLALLGRSWFTGALLLWLAFLVGEAAGAVLSALERRRRE